MARVQRAQSAQTAETEADDTLQPYNYKGGNTGLSPGAGDLRYTGENLNFQLII